MNGNSKDLLLENGTLLPDGTISKDKINLLSGAHTPDFAEMIWTITNGDQSTINRMTDLFTRMYSEGLEQELMDVIGVLHGVAGIQLPPEIEALACHPEARQYYLFEFLLDFDDVIQELISEEMAQGSSFLP